MMGWIKKLFSCFQPLGDHWYHMAGEHLLLTDELQVELRFAVWQEWVA